MALGFLAGLMSWTVVGRREGRDFNFCSDLLFWVMVSGIVGGRLAYVAGDLGHFLAEPLAVFRVDQGGLVYYGGFFGGAVGLVLFARRRRQPLAKLLDFVVPSVPLGHAFGRLGCFFNGCCHGAPHAGAAAVTFPAYSPAWWRQVDSGLLRDGALHSLPVHPVQLYETALNLVLYVVLVSFYRRRRRDGSVVALYFLTYPVGRFLLEFLRGDERSTAFGLSRAQCGSLVLFAAGCALAAVLARRGRE